MDASPLAPAWFVLPLAAVTMIVQAGYLLAIREATPSQMPPSRKRIRTATGWLTMFAIPLSAYGFGIATPANPGVFAIVWVLVIGLLVGIVTLALLDTANTMRLHRKANRNLRRELHALLRDAGRAQRPERSGDEP